MSELKNRLNNEQLQNFKTILENHSEIFRDQPGCIQNYVHTLEVHETTPYKKFQYTLNPKLVIKAKTEINKMINDGVIERSTSCYINPLILVEKKDGSVRLCLDGRFLNKRLKPLYDAPPTINDLLYKCAKARYLATVDLRSSFWQVPLDEKSREYTGFQFMNQTLHFKRVPFGLSVSLSALVRALRTVIPENISDNVKVYVDDILIHAETIEEFLDVLAKLFSALKENNVTVNLAKSKFFRSSIPFLGYILTDKGIRKDEEKVKVIQNFKRPENVKQLQSFLGFVNFYQKFCYNYANITKSLYKLTSVKKNFVWQDEHEEAFELIKISMQEDVVLNYPELNEVFYLQCDSSLCASAGVLYQIDKEGRHKIISFCSRTFKNAELNYYTTEKELLAIIHAVQKFYSLIAGYKIIVKTDNSAITFLTQCKNPPCRLLRWMTYLGNLDISYEHIAGRDNKLADFISRNPIEQPEQVDCNFKVSSVVEREFFEGIAAHQQADQKINNNLEKRGHKYKVIDGLVNKNLGNRYCICLTECDMIALIRMVHERFSHVGIAKCVRIIAERFYCKNLKKLALNEIKFCEVCQFTKVAKGLICPYQSIVPKGKLDTISIDYLGPFIKVNKFKYVLVIVDNYTKFVKLYATRSANVQWAIRAVESFIREVGTPSRCLSDNATCFTSPKWENFLANNGIRRVLTSIRHPQANLSERVNKDVLKYLRVMIYACDNQHKQWFKQLERIEKVINETYHVTTGFTPVQAMFGGEPVRFWETYVGKRQDNSKLLSADEISEIIRKKLKKRERRNDLKYNRHRKFSIISVGDLVLVKALRVPVAMQHNAKLLPIYEGPYKVIEKVGKCTYILQGEQQRVRGMFHQSLIRKYYDR